MKTHKVTIILKNDIPNQPPFGFAFLLHQDGQLCRVGIILGPLGDRLQLTDWQYTSERSVRPVYRWNRMLPDGHDVGPWRHTTRFTILDRETGKEYHFSDMQCESITMEDWTDTPPAIDDESTKLLEAYLDAR